MISNGCYEVGGFVFGWEGPGKILRYFTVRFAVSGECGKILGNFSLSSLRCE